MSMKRDTKHFGRDDGGEKAVKKKDHSPLAEPAGKGSHFRRRGREQAVKG